MRLIFIFCFCLLLGACRKNFFELNKPLEPAVQTIADMNRAVAGTYYSMTGASGNNSNFDALDLFAAAVSDESVAVPKAGDRLEVLELYQRQNTTQNSITNSIYIPCYGTIAAANSWLDAIRTGNLNTLSGKDSLPLYEGELKFLRAYNYWILVKVFCPPFESGGTNDQKILPLRLTPTRTLTDANTPASATSEIYKAIERDLVEAVQKLPAVSLAPGRTNKFAAAALLARVLFQMGNFAEAEKQASFVIEQGSNFNLAEDPIIAFNRDWSGNGKEILWSYAIGTTPAAPNGLGGVNSNWKVPRRFAYFNFNVASSDNTIPGNGGGGISANPLNRTLAISASILKSVGWINADSTPTQAARNDKRFSQLYTYIAGADPRFPNIPRRLYWINKFYRGPQSDYRIGAVPLVRLAEMYLTRSIIRFNKGDKVGAAEDLNVVAKRAWDATAAGSAFVPVSAGTITAAMIHNERWKELSFEADRIFYLQALKINIPNGDRDGSTIPYNSPSLYWPLPLTEYDLNTGL
jgi:hypothetical protein